MLRPRRVDPVCIPLESCESAEAGSAGKRVRRARGRGLSPNLSERSTGHDMDDTATRHAVKLERELPQNAWTLFDPVLVRSSQLPFKFFVRNLGFPVEVWAHRYR